MKNDVTRYARQTMFKGIGLDGQQKLLAAKVVIIGCGATGTVIANHLARAGVGHVVIIDRDFIELNNLQRQLLFDETDLAENLPKAIAAARKLQRINHDIRIEGVVTDVNPENIENLVSGANLVMDGTDNFETRYLINDICLKLNIPWIYTGVVSSYGMSQTIIPGQTPCLRCLFPNKPAPGSSATCDTVGVVGPVVGAVASISATEALKYLVGQGDLNHGIIHLDLWDLQLAQFETGEPKPDCVACGAHRYDFLEGDHQLASTTLCGRDAVHIQMAQNGEQSFQLAQIKARLNDVATISAANNFLIRFAIPPQYEITVFADGRAIVKGTDDETIAKNLYSKYIGY